jgi:hypothetical protein
MKHRIGIDIGLKGAVCIFEDNKLVKLQALPKDGNDIPDIKAFVELILSYQLNDAHVVIEDLHSIYGSSAGSNFQFGWTCGAIEAVLITLALPYTRVQAKRWQKEMWEGVRPVTIASMEKKKGQPATQKLDKKGNPKFKVDTKATSLIAAQRLFPDQSFLATARSKKPHDGIVDAILIGEYCRRNF